MIIYIINGTNIFLQYQLNIFFNRFSRFHSIIIIQRLSQLKCEYLTDNYNI